VEAVSGASPAGRRTSAMAVPPTADMPIPKPTRPCSLMGMLSTRSGPNSSSSPCVQRNTPPNPTSSPNTTACGLDWSSILIASLMAVNIFICFVSPSIPGRVDSPRLNPRSAGRRSALRDRAGRANILRREDVSRLALADRHLTRRQHGLETHFRQNLSYLSYLSYLTRCRDLFHTRPEAGRLSQG
jgi:hypothetical protein